MRNGSDNEGNAESRNGHGKAVPSARLRKDPASRHRVLIVDDSRSILETLRAFLAGRGYEVDVAESAERGWSSFTANPHELLIADVNLPGMSGLDLVRRVRKHSPRTSAIVITGDPFAETMAESLRAGASDFLVKPFDGQALITAMERALRSTQGRNVPPRPDPSAPA